MQIKQQGLFPAAFCPWKPARSWIHLKIKLRVLKVEGGVNTQEIHVLSFMPTPQPTSVTDTFNKSAQQRCSPRKIHCNSVTALLFRAYKSLREPCYLPGGATQGLAVCSASCITWLAQGKSASPLYLHVSAKECILLLSQGLYVKGMSWSHGCNSYLISAFNKQVQYRLDFTVFPFAPWA